jgi:hypothetical protein
MPETIAVALPPELLDQIDRAVAREARFAASPHPIQKARK